MLMRVLVALMLFLAVPSMAAEGFSFTDIKGKPHTLAGYKGKWVLVNFWATWCPPCIDEIPDLIELHDKHKNRDLVVLGVAMDYREPSEIVRFAADNFISYPVILGTPKMMAEIGNVPGYPTSFLYNPQGKMVAYNNGAVTRKAIEDYIHSKKSGK